MDTKDMSLLNKLLKDNWFKGQIEMIACTLFTSG